MKFVWTLVGTLTVAVVTSDPVYIQPVCTIPSPDADTVSIQCSTTSKIFQFFLNAKSAGAFLSNVSAWEKRHGNVSINNNRVDFNVVLLSSFRDGKKSRMYVLLTFSHSAGQLDINATCRSENNQSHINSNTLDKCHRTLIANNGTLAIHYVKTVEMNDSFLYIYTVSHQQQLDYVLLSGPQKEAHFQTSANQSLLVVLSRDKEFNISLGTGENSLTNVSSVPLSTTTATEISSMSGESGKDGWVITT